MQQLRAKCLACLMPLICFWVKIECSCILLCWSVAKVLKPSLFDMSRFNLDILVLNIFWSFSLFYVKVEDFQVRTA